MIVEEAKPPNPLVSIHSFDKAVSKSVQVPLSNAITGQSLQQKVRNLKYESFDPKTKQAAKDYLAACSLGELRLDDR